MPAPSPPASPETVVQDQALSLEPFPLNHAWKPYHLTTLAAFSGPILPGDATVTFHPDFLANTLGGACWSPGLRFIKGKGPCILKNRTYYQLDPQNEPYLPEAPGKHGAKLTAFFNKAPEEEFADLLDDDSNSYEDVPMFVLVGKRYMYYGNYSQTRWSDKLDYDTMTTRVPRHVKNYWAEELTSTTREEWVTEELKKHFFRKPEYEGRLFAAPDHETTVNSEKEIELTEKMTRDVRKYVEELREWEREANMKTAMIKKQSILEAFDAVSCMEVRRRWMLTKYSLIWMRRLHFASGGNTLSVSTGGRTSTTSLSHFKSATLEATYSSLAWRMLDWIRRLLSMRNVDQVRLCGLRRV
jgi:hypothetical protein